MRTPGLRRFFMVRFGAGGFFGVEGVGVGVR